jgi:membrane protein implicated in regulation of membrane protease activity
MNVVYVWLILGVLLLIAEVAGAPGAGLLFAGLAAIVTSIFIHVGMVPPDGFVTQLIIFFIATAVWALLLWKPLKKFNASRGHGGYSNIIGDTAYVGSNGLTKRGGGEVTWSGTIMQARLSPDAGIDRLEAGSQVTIVEMSGATLTVKPKD